MYQMILCVLTKKSDTHNIMFILSMSGDMGFYVEVTGKIAEELQGFCRTCFSKCDRTLMFIGIKMKKKHVTELGHSYRLKIYVKLSKSYVNPGIYVHSKFVQMTYSLKPLHP